MIAGQKPVGAVAGAGNHPLQVGKAILLTLFMFAGFAGVFLFIWKQNYAASWACLMMEILSVIYLQLTTAVIKGTLQAKYTHTRLKVVFILTIVVGVIEAVACLSYASLAYMYKQDFRVEGQSYYIAIIPAAVAALIAPCLAYEARLAMAQFAQGPTGMVHFPA